MDTTTTGRRPTILDPTEEIHPLTLTRAADVAVSGAAAERVSMMIANVAIAVQARAHLVGRIKEGAGLFPDMSLLHGGVGARLLYPPPVSGE